MGGRYVVDRVIGNGGMGAVVAARHLTLGESIAVKFLHPRLAKDPASVERFVREAQAASRIKSEHVIRIHDIGATDQGLPYIAMELLQGTDLGALLANGPVALTLAVDCVLQAAEALAEAHAAGIVHRDVKPSNLWLSTRSDNTANLKVLDFGISKLVSADGDAKLTETQAVFGSPAYMSPEQIRSAKRVDHRTDVWALGVVLYELLSGRVPFEADNIAGVLAAITADPPRPLHEVRPDVPATLEAVVLSCLVKELDRRATLRDLAAGLRPFASPVGQLAANRIEAMALPRVSVVPPMPSRSLPSVAITDTAPDLSQASLLRRLRDPLAAALGVLLLGLGALFVKVWRPPSGTMPGPALSPAAASPAPVASLAPSVAISSAPSTATLPTPPAVPTAAATATASSRIAPSEARGPRGRQPAQLPPSQAPRTASPKTTTSPLSEERR